MFQSGSANKRCLFQSVGRPAAAGQQTPHFCWARSLKASTNKNHQGHLLLLKQKSLKLTQKSLKPMESDPMMQHVGQQQCYVMSRSES